MMKIAISSLTALLALLLHADQSAARSWRDIIPMETLSVPDHVDIANLLNANNPLFTFAPTVDPLATFAPTFTPTGWPTLNPTFAPTTDAPTLAPTLKPSALPSSAPTAEFPENDVPLFADDSYFNYDTRPGAQHGPGHAVMDMAQSSTGGFTVSYENNNWANVDTPSNSYWKEFTDDGFGAWKGVLQDRRPLSNRCGETGEQSPIDVRHNGLADCEEGHEVRSMPGDMRINGDMVKIQIQPNKLRILYQRRPCGDLLNVACQEPDPPHADFPNGWGGFADTMHVDFKIPSEHWINGQRYDAEMQVYNLHPDRERIAAHAQVITAEPSSHNWYFEQALLAFEYEYERDLAICAASVRRDRQLVTDMHAVFGLNHGNNVTSGEFVDYETWAQYSTIMDHPRYHQYSEEMKAHRHLQNVGFDPLHSMLVPSIHFYRYEGSITEPPCGEFVSWFVTDVPMIISTDQLQRLKTYLFNHVNTMCMRTSVHHAESVARPLQEIAGRPVHLCTPRDFGPDDPNGA